ncbi:MAG: polysaccharide biosynthesis/export family protein [Hyphomicrobiaceae bacterium]
MNRIEALDHADFGNCPHRPSHRLMQIGVAACLSLFVFGSMTPVSADDEKSSPVYRLDAMDKIRIRVFEWRPTLDRVFDWARINDTYAIGPAGDVSIPLVGSISARGKTTAELEVALSQKINKLARTVRDPNITVEIASYRPFYILGLVQRPGEYSFRPNLTAMQAISIAGGLVRAKETDERNLISALGQDRVASARYYALIAKRARIRSALADHESIRFPDDLSDKQLKDNETRAFNSERSSLQDALRTMAKKKEYLEQAVTSLQDQLKNHDLERDLSKAALTRLEKLHRRKLVTDSRRTAARLNFYQLERIRLRTQSELNRTTQTAYEAAAEMHAFKNERQEKLIVELNETELQIRLIRQEQRTTMNLIADALRKAPMAGLSDPGSNYVLSYTITRTVNGQAKEMPAEGETMVHPGDIFKVKLTTRNSSDPVKSKERQTTLLR